jgi:RNA polymerase sigma-70 factor, ECF subfamily
VAARKSLHPDTARFADQKVEAKLMGHAWQPDFEPLVDEHQSMVFSLALRMTGDRGLAEEIAQDVFLELDRNLGKIESAEHARHWLRRVTMSRSADALRRRRVRGMDLWVEMDEANGAHKTEERSSPLGSRMEYLLTTLPEAQRAALVLRYQEDMLPEEIAATMDAPLATVKSNLQRGLKLLRAKATSHLREYIRGI